MGRRGPLPTPTPILKARGSWLAKKRKNEPTPKSGRPHCPSHLSPDARKIWRRVVPLLEGMRVLTKADGAALERYCFLLSHWRKEADRLEKHGSVYPVRRDGVVLFKLLPTVKVFDMLTTQLGRMEQAFGLNPASRARLAMPLMTEQPYDDSDELARIIRVGPPQIR